MCRPSQNLKNFMCSSQNIEWWWLWRMLSCMIYSILAISFFIWNRLKEHHLYIRTHIFSLAAGFKCVYLCKCYWSCDLFALLHMSVVYDIVYPAGHCTSAVFCWGIGFTECVRSINHICRWVSCFRYADRQTVTERGIQTVCKEYCYQSLAVY